MKESIVKLAKELEGMQTIETIQKKLKIVRSTAIKKIHILRKYGLAKTSGGGKQKRIYTITPFPQMKRGFPGLYDIINEYSPIKLATTAEYRMLSKKLTIEEAIIRAINTKSIRVIIASLALFRHVKDWSRLYRFAKKHNVRRKVGALYDVARKIIRVRKMTKRVRKNLLKGEEKDKFIVANVKSKDFLDIQKKWKIFVPLNRADLMRYREWSR